MAREWPDLLNGAETGVKIQQAVEGKPSSQTDPRCRSEMLQWGGHLPGHVLIPILQHALALPLGPSAVKKPGACFADSRGLRAWSSSFLRLPR